MPGQILVIDPVAVNRILLRGRLGLSCPEVRLALDQHTGSAVLSAHPIDLVLIGPGFDPAAACALTHSLRQSRRPTAPPVVILASHATASDRYAALNAGAEDLLDSSLQDAYLLARIRGLLRQETPLARLAEPGLLPPLPDPLAPEPPGPLAGLAEPPTLYSPPTRIALVTRSSTIAHAWSKALNGRLGPGIECLTPEQALRPDGPGPRPDLLILEETAQHPDAALPVLAELRSQSAKTGARILLVAAPPPVAYGATSPAREQHLSLALDVGADDILRDGFDTTELTLRARRLLDRKRQEDRMRGAVQEAMQAANHDPLTGLHNRRYALPALERLAQSAARLGQSYAVMLIDLDRFKSVNDTHGHRVGDRVLAQVAERLRAGVRHQDLLARIGGEEFLLALPDTDLETAGSVAQRLCQTIRDERIIPDPGHLPIRVTVSIGIAQWRPGQSPCSGPRAPGGDRAAKAEATRLLEQADQALYAAKSSGRNTVTVSRHAA